MTQLVGILNLTPDSFSDGGKITDAEAAYQAILNLAREGANIVDIGAESTRPGATPLTAEQEIARLSELFAILKKQKPPVQLSIDTRQVETAQAALDAGFDWVNDVSGFSNTVMVDAVRGSNCKCVVMHSLSIPASKDIVMDCAPEEATVQISAWAEKRFAELEQGGISRDRIILDPGIGFGKTPEQSRALIRDIATLQKLGVPLFIGHSRKSFLGGGLATRDEKTLEVSRDLIRQNVEYLRVHNVAAHQLLLEQAA